ncbi:hypothetical protein [Halopelagius fulvigenes]|uniref:Uncharacterized protein n=1 Tax=Halopelagius fulvigenes TaxID=1198324 RepID=A0ABD5TU96_9EURY
MSTPAPTKAARDERPSAVEDEGEAAESGIHDGHRTSLGNCVAAT